jgi:hypothetical protein
MMKTSGTSLSKMLVGHFGSAMHIVPGGLDLNAELYSEGKLNRDFDIFHEKLRVISGHPVRPFINYGAFEDQLIWVTFLRDPYKRFISHYLHDLNWTVHFKNMPDLSLHAWEQNFANGNYQVKFLAGEPNLQKAIDIIHEKIKVVGLTEFNKTSLCIFKTYLGLDNFHIDLSKTNSSLEKATRQKDLIKEEMDFIAEKNQLDRKLYDYILENVWPAQIAEVSDTCDAEGKPRWIREWNMINFQIKRQMSYGTVKLNWKNAKRFYKRWYR